MHKKIIEKPSVKVINTYIDHWNNLDKYVAQEKSLEKLFNETYPLNECIDEVLVKVATLNDFYSTDIKYPYETALNIINASTDRRLNESDLELVEDIADLNSLNINKKIYSFATKYCSHHRPKIYPIYDSYVKKMLCYYRDRYSFYLFEDNELREYPKYIEIINKFKEKFSLNNCSYKDTDKFLWQAEKKYFPKNNSERPDQLQIRLASKFLGISAEWLRTLIKKGRIQSRKYKGRVRIKLSELYKYLSEKNDEKK